MNAISTEKLFADVKVLIEDVEELIKATGGQAGEQIVELRERLQRKLAEGKAALAAREKDLRQRGEQARACAIHFFCKESWARLVMAGALGLLLGLMLRRTRVALRCKRNSERLAQ